VTLPFRRRSDSWSSKHERARARAAQRLSGPLDPAEDDWLDRHLADCAPCRAVAEAYERDSLELRALREHAVEPPRDLWARTAAAIEREAVSTSERARSRPSVVPLGAISGLLVVAVVLGATLLSGRPGPAVAPSPSLLIAQPLTPTLAPSPAPTPLLARGEFEWLGYGEGGRVTLFRDQYSEVCPENGAGCAPLEDATPKTEVDVSAAPDQAISSRDGRNLVFVDTSDADRNKILVIPVPTPTVAPAESPTILPERSPTPPAAGGSPTPAESPLPTPSVEPTIRASETTPPPSTVEPSVEPTAPPASVEPSAAPTPFEIADDVVLIGAPQFNRDGTRLAFSARPADGSHGPDIFVWTAGQADATPITEDHRSVFSGWLDGLLLGSRPLVPTALVTSPEAFVIDPETGTNATVEGFAAWRPSVDPTARLAAYWDGTIARDENGVDWRPAGGRLVVGPWPGTPALRALDESADPEAAAPSPPAAPIATPAPTIPLAIPSTALSGEDLEILFDAPVRDWIARWDPLGDRLAVWIAHPDDPTIGRLSLYALNDKTDRMDADRPELSGELARPGFSIGVGQLAWATREGQDGKGSHVKVVAWTARGTGTVETKPGEDVLVVQH
jgi:hypothetical protein